MGRLASNLGIVLIMAMFIFAGFLAVQTSSVVYNQFSNETTVIAENSTFHKGANYTSSYANTKSYNPPSREKLIDDEFSEIHWDYSFGTNFNIFPPAQLTLKIYGIAVFYVVEKMNISIYNYGTSQWELLNETTKLNEFENITTVLTWQNRNLTNYINQANGRMNISLEDNKSAESGAEVYIDYIGMNATFSPLTDEMVAIANSLGVTYFSAENYTRYNYTRADMLWVGAEWMKGFKNY
jgi:hypothetical protein